ncbi:hypothetical protein FJT64_025130 [Amphibalanus amphitrite]|uniref:Uncharacterized protein n=1 Tax=Amphibalanus amphitrite TaxID=1232801 RepID=A0A6A4WC88_AMPAM|nr:hypothetical protein FJT64_025130 [Amphibalanus amphitrite]
MVKKLLEGDCQQIVPTLATARAARNGLMTVMLVNGAGRPSHVTGIMAKDVATARDVELEVEPYKMVRNSSLKTARPHRHEAPCPLRLWRRLCIHVDKERPLLVACGGEGRIRLWPSGPRGLTNHARLCRRSPVHVDTPSLSLSRETADADRPAPGDDALSLPPLTPPEAPVRGSASDPGPGSPRSSLSSPLVDRPGSGGRPAADDVTDADVE